MLFDCHPTTAIVISFRSFRPFLWLFVWPPAIPPLHFVVRSFRLFQPSSSCLYLTVGAVLPLEPFRRRHSWPLQFWPQFGPYGRRSAVAFVGFDHRLAATTIDIALRPLPSVHSNCRHSFRLPPFIPPSLRSLWPLLGHSGCSFDRTCSSSFFFFAIITGSVPLFHHRLCLSPFPAPLFLTHSYCHISFLDII